MTNSIEDYEKNSIPEDTVVCGRLMNKLMKKKQCIVTIKE